MSFVNRALFYTLEFNGELVSSIDTNFTITFHKDEMKKPTYMAKAHGHVYQQPFIVQKTSDILPVWFPLLTRHFGKLPVTENWLQLHGKQALQHKLDWLNKFTVTRWLITDGPSHDCWNYYKDSPANLSPSFAKCLKNIERVLSFA